ncbi:MAG: hypothetical protein AAFX94_04320 [Myxococcota bacterium]
MRSGALLCLALVCACGDSQGDSPWRSLGVFAYHAQDGVLLTEPIEVPGGRFAAYVETDGCAQLASLHDAETTFISSLEGGVSCLGCTPRHSMVVESGIVVHDSGESGAGSTTLQFGRLDCETLTRLSPDGMGGEAQIWIRSLPESSGSTRLPLRFRHSAASGFSEPGTEDALLDEVDALLPTGIEVEIAASISEPDFPGRLSWFEGEATAAGDSGPSSGVDVVFAGCIERVDPVSGRRTVLDAMVPRVPAFGSPGAAIYIAGRSCFFEDPLAVSVPNTARRLVHELGHFLGLFHSVERSGREDDLEDTDAGTLMVVDPVLAADPSFSPAQVRRMRAHARLLADGLPGPSAPR